MTATRELNLASTRNPNLVRRGNLGGSHRLPVSLVGVGVLFTCLMLMAPTVSANSLNSPTVTLTSPYSGTPLTIRETVAENCGTGSLTHGPAFNFASGVGRVQANTSSNTSASCASP